MKRASVTEAKNGLSALLDRVKHGETVVIEDRGVAVAQIGPVSPTDRGLDADRLAHLERRGVIRHGESVRPASALLTRPPRPARRQALSQSVVDERSGGW